MHFNYGVLSFYFMHALLSIKTHITNILHMINIIMKLFIRYCNDIEILKYDC